MKITTKFNPGDVVTAITGGPKMTVDAVCVAGRPELVGLVWFEGSEGAGWGSLRREQLMDSALTKVE